MPRKFSIDGAKQLDGKISEKTDRLLAASYLYEGESGDGQQMGDILSNTERSYQKLIEILPIGIFQTDVRGQYSYVNQRWCEITGLTPQEAMGEGWVTSLHPEDRDRVVSQWKQAIKNNTPFKGEYRFQRSDGQIRWVLCQAVAEKGNAGEIIGYAGTIAEITEIKQAQQAILESPQNLNGSKCQIVGDKASKPVPMTDILLEASDRQIAEDRIREQAALLDVATDAIIVHDINNQILFWNKSAEVLYGWQAQEAINKNANDILYKKGVTQLEEAYCSVLRKGEWYGELEQVTKGGKEIIVSSRWTLVRDEEKQPKSILLVNTDITQKKLMEEQFYRAQRLESIGTLASGIAHDLNNVLTPILASAQLLLKVNVPEDKKEWLLTTLEVNAKRAASLVKQVLSFARGIEGKRSVLQVKHLILEVRQIIQETFPKSIEVETDVDSELWSVYGDATLLHQVLMNLCVNARDAMLNGGNLYIYAKNILIDENYARMSIDAKVGPYIIITVADTGTGIAPEILDKIFEPFFTTKELGKGTGLGLATTLGIIKSHDGFVNVTSKVGKGTQFKVFLPAVEATETVEVDEIDLPVGDGELILVVDDENAILEISKTSLETYNYKVMTASNGIEAIALYAKHKERINLVLLDMMMPEMDGPTTIRTLQKMDSSVKIIAISGLETSDKMASAAGVETFLSKPYTARDLFQAIRTVLRE